MARSHARVHVAIWNDDDFRSLTPSAQRLYLFLLSQPNLTHLGVLPLTLRRWTPTARGYTSTDLTHDLDALTCAGFVVVDEDAEELLVRSLLRRDGIYKQPNVMRAAIASAPAVQSVRIKRTLLSEVARIDLSEMTEEKKREEAQTLLRTLEQALEVPPDPDPGAMPEPFAEPLPEGFGIPPTHARARPLVLSPTPTTSPTSGEGPAAASAADGFDEWWAAYPLRKGKEAARKAYAKALRSTDHRTLVDAALAFMWDPTRDPKFTPYPATWLNQGRWEDEGPAQVPSTALALVRPNASEQRTLQNIALIEEMRRLDEAGA